jgi:hypothetical protein
VRVARPARTGVEAEGAIRLVAVPPCGSRSCVPAPAFPRRRGVPSGIFRANPGYSGLPPQKTMGGVADSELQRQIPSLPWLVPLCGIKSEVPAHQPHPGPVPTSSRTTFCEAIVSYGETNSWRAWEAKFPLSMWEKLAARQTIGR